VKTHLLAVIALLTAQQSRQVKKLEAVSDLILSKKPLAIIPTIIELATSMTVHHEKIIQRYAAVAKINTKDDEGVLYVPKSACINSLFVFSYLVLDHRTSELCGEKSVGLSSCSPPGYKTSLRNVYTIHPKSAGFRISHQINSHSSFVKPLRSRPSGIAFHWTLIQHKEAKDHDTG
jgi:hypothetical protein